MTARLILAVVLCVLTLSLAACGGGGNGITVAHPDTEQPMRPETPTEPMGLDIESKKWTCYALTDSRKKTPLVSLIQSRVPGVENVALGGVAVSGVSKPAVVRSEGVNLRWDFSDLDLVAFVRASRNGVLSKHIRYAFVLRPDGTGLYYDFSASDDGRAKPRQFFQCLRS